MTVMRNLLQALALSGVALASTLTTYGRYPNISVDHPPWREKFLGELAYFREQLVRDIQKFRISKRVTGTLFQSQFNVEIWEHPACQSIGLSFNIDSRIHGSEGRNEVYKVSCNQNQKHYAVKLFKNSQDYLQEVDFYTHAEHRGILHPICVLHGHWLKGHSGTKMQGGLVLEWFDGVDALKYARSQKTKPEDLVQVAAKVFDVLAYVHYIRFVHADLKPENILVNPNTGDVKVIDFGLALRLPANRRNKGNVNVLAPELANLVPGQIHEGIDWWAYGSTLATLFAYKYLPAYTSLDLNHKDNRHMRYVAFEIGKRGQYFTVEGVPDAFPAALRHLLYLCWDPNPDNRQFNTDAKLNLLRRMPFFDTILW